MYATQSSGLFVVMFVLLQIVSTGLDIYFESSIMSWITAEKKDFGKYRMFGSLGDGVSVTTKRILYAPVSLCNKSRLIVFEYN